MEKTDERWPMSKPLRWIMRERVPIELHRSFIWLQILELSVQDIQFYKSGKLEGTDRYVKAPTATNHDGNV